MLAHRPDIISERETYLGLSPHTHNPQIGGVPRSITFCLSILDVGRDVAVSRTPSRHLLSGGLILLTVKRLFRFIYIALASAVINQQVLSMTDW